MLGEIKLELLFLIPIIGMFIVAWLPFETKEEKEIGKTVGLGFSILTLFQAIRMWISFDKNTADFQYTMEIAWNLNEWGQKGIMFGVDGISINFILLTCLLIPVCMLASWDSVKILEKEYIIGFLSMLAMLIGVFTILDLLGFYVMFEGILIPMFLIIGVWGSRVEKIRAAYYFFLYTLIGSVLMLLSIMYIYKDLGTTDYLTLVNIGIEESKQYWIFLAFFASLAVKIPKFPFHIWLPLAHVEAPVGGSVILAGILIKLGAYGFIRFSIPLLPVACVYFTPLIYTLGVLSIIYAGLTTLRQTDLKRIIAYSSVGHMGVVSIAIFSLTVIGLEGSIFLQIAHGLVSSALFILVTIIYDRHHTRIVKYYRGLTMYMPIYSSIFLFFTLANIAVPLSCNFVGEFLGLLAVWQTNPFICILSCSGIILSAAYALFLYNRVCFGAVSPYLESSGFANRDINRREFFVLLPLIFFTLLLGVYPEVVLDTIHPAVLNILNAIE